MELIVGKNRGKTFSSPQVAKGFYFGPKIQQHSTLAASHTSADGTITAAWITFVLRLLVWKKSIFEYMLRLDDDKPGRLILSPLFFLFALL